MSADDSNHGGVYRDAAGEFEWSECGYCDGTGDDPTEWDGRCRNCYGHGEVKRYIEEQDDYDDLAEN